MRVFAWNPPLPPGSSDWQIDVFFESGDPEFRTDCWDSAVMIARVNELNSENTYNVVFFESNEFFVDFVASRVLSKILLEHLHVAHLPFHLVNMDGILIVLVVHES